MPFSSKRIQNDILGVIGDLKEKAVSGELINSNKINDYLSSYDMLENEKYGRVKIY